MTKEMVEDRLFETIVYDGGVCVCVKCLDRRKTSRPGLAILYISYVLFVAGDHWGFQGGR